MQRSRDLLSYKPVLYFRFSFCSCKVVLKRIKRVPLYLVLGGAVKACVKLDVLDTVTDPMIEEWQYPLILLLIIKYP